jgi:hypothetical protein
LDDAGGKKEQAWVAQSAMPSAWIGHGLGSPKEPRQNKLTNYFNIGMTE